MHNLHCSVFPFFGASECDAPWLPLTSVIDCIFGLRLCTLEHVHLLTRIHGRPTAPGKLAGVNTFESVRTSSTRTHSMNFLLNVTWLSDNVRT